MYTKRTRTPGTTIATLSLALALAAANLGVCLPAAFADDPVTPADPAAEQAGSQAPASAQSQEGEEAADPAAPEEPGAADNPGAAEPVVTYTSLGYHLTNGVPEYDVNRTAALPTMGVDLTLTNDLGQAAELLDAINAYRAENGVPALGNDPILEASAYQRAAESVLLNANVRPDGTLFDTVGVEISGWDIIFSEIILTGNPEAQLDATAAFDAIAASEDSWMLLNGGAVGALLTAGVACVEDAAGNVYWAVLFSVGGAPPDYVATPVAEGEVTYRVRVSAANLTVVGYGGDLGVEAGAAKPIPMPANVGGELPLGARTAAFTPQVVNLSAGDYTWNTSNPSVATAENGIATGVAPGTCVLSAANAQNMQFIYNVTVGDGNARTAYDLAECTIAGILGSYVDTGLPQEPAFTVIDPEGVAVDPVNYTYAFANNAAPGTATLTVTAVEGSKAVTGSTVKTFDITAVQVLVPKVAGSYPDAAAGALEAAGLLPYLAEGEPASSTEATGIVYATKPAGDTRVDVGSTVTIYYYAAPVTTPNEVLPEDGAKSQDSTDVPADNPVSEPEGGSEPVQPADEQLPTDLLAAGASVSLDAGELAYTGEPLEPAVTVTLGDGTVLAEGADYTVAYGNNVGPTTSDNPASVTVAGTGAYAGTLSATFAIFEPEPVDPDAIDLAGAGFSIAPIDPVVLGDAPCEPRVYVLNGSTALIQGADYTVAYAKNDAPGTATVTVKGTGAYGGTLTYDFQVLGNLATGGAAAPIADCVYNGLPATPAPTVTFGGVELVEGTDYTLAYVNNVDASTSEQPATVTVTGTGTYTGSFDVAFTILPTSIRDAQIAPIASVTYTGFDATPAVTVTLDGLVLAGGTDYTVTYENNVDAGTAHVVVKGTGNYCDFIDTTFVIAPVSITRATIVMPNEPYTGQPLAPVPVSVTVGDTPLQLGVDYTVSGYGNNVDPGTATATVQGMGNYTGSVPASWTIVKQANAADAGTTETLPATGDSTNMVFVAIAAVVGAALVIAALALIVANARKPKGSRRDTRGFDAEDYDDYR